MPLPHQLQMVKSWLKLAVLTLALSGLAPLVLIAGRASMYADIALVKQWFTPMLVVHVNLSVGLWFLAMAMALAMLLSPLKHAWKIVHQAASISFLLGILAIALAPLAGGDAYTSNYIPVQNNPLFFAGLGFVMASLLLMAGGALFLAEQTHAYSVPMQLTLLTLLSALAAFIFSFVQHPAGYGGEGFYESIFWGGGHLLQFVYVQIGMLAWLVLGEALRLPKPPKKFVQGLFGFLWLNSLVILAVYWVYDVNDGRHMQWFTWQMIAVVGPVPALLALWYIPKLTKMDWRAHRPAAGCFIFSLLLFMLGGAIGLVIEGSNTVIPSHYHGSTVGITLALMGAAYVLFPQLGAKAVSGWKMAAWQPCLYGLGQIMHVIGLAVAGGHNIQRKTAGSLDAADQAAAAALQVMRLGGLLAVIGGGLFVVVAIRAFRSGKLSH